MIWPSKRYAASSALTVSPLADDDQVPKQTQRHREKHVSEQLSDIRRLRRGEAHVLGPLPVMKHIGSNRLGSFCIILRRTKCMQAAPKSAFCYCWPTLYNPPPSTIHHQQLLDQLSSTITNHNHYQPNHSPSLDGSFINHCRHFQPTEPSITIHHH